MEIETMAANCALLKARDAGNAYRKGRSRKWKEILRFPHINECKELENSIERDYYSLCVNQPIGKQLFMLFCATKFELQHLIDLLDEMAKYEVTTDDLKKTSREKLINKFKTSQSPKVREMVHEEMQKCNWNMENFISNCQSALHEYLSEAPFSEYQKSMYFDRFLQWKMVERRPVTQDTFREYRILGKGGFGEVCACQSRASGKMYACKKLVKKRVKKQGGEKMVLKEKQILERVNSRFVVSLAYTYETKDSLCLVLTVMDGGDLGFHIYKMGNEKLDKNRIQFYAAEVLCGLDHLHKHSVVYRDLKPENILLDYEGHIRISDLGLAEILPENKLVNGRVGTAGYMAPEVVAGTSYGVSVDWWGLGCLIYEMTAKKPPFRNHKEQVSKKDLNQRILEKAELYGKMFDEETQDICKNLLGKNPKERLGCRSGQGAEVIKSHQFFKNINFTLLEAGMTRPPFIPDPRAIYCDDVSDIDQFAAVKGVTLGQTDEDFYAEFNTGCVTVPWQTEMIETECFKDLNVFGQGGSRSPDLDRSAPIQPTYSETQSSSLKIQSQPLSRSRLLGKIFRRPKDEPAEPIFRKSSPCYEKL
ncbi:G protein-coupled receptor kinase 5 [Danio aesculapii]|uniref:G protein-coupled receptor kinase 5 n=1 Tax=Danio aesculapii TaxID=1142201 RepID=UPI0024BF1A57|nr:G protein-coupled receptor kinase 5 [Danio aesculapii]